MSNLSIVDTPCRVKGCPNWASIQTFPYCHEHKGLRPPEFGPDVQTDPSREELRYAMPRKCFITECNRPGETKFMGLCRVCHSSDLQRPTAYALGTRRQSRGSEPSLKTCKKPNCNRIALKTERGQCLKCDLDEGHKIDIRAHILHAAYPYTLNFQQQWYQAKCVFPQCERDGFEVLNGLCESCYRQLCQANANCPVRESLDEVTLGRYLT